MTAVPELWGVLNVTPDSFSDGGRFLAVDAALRHAERMCAEGADVIDVGGASSRPPGAAYGAGAQDVPEDLEVARVVPVVEQLCARGWRVSVDTTRAGVAERALAAGATIVNDVSGHPSDAMLDVVSARGAGLVLMHSRLDGRVAPPATTYADVVSEVLRELGGEVARAANHGIPAERLWIDPGIGFAKTASQSATLLGALARFVETGPRVLLGASRKSFIAALAPRADGTPPEPRERLAGSLAAVVFGVVGGVHALRVHDVAESRQAALVAAAARGARGAPASSGACHG